MQLNTIVLQVDELDDAVLVPTTYTRFEEIQNRTTYLELDNHSSMKPRKLQLYRSPLSSPGLSFGKQKSAVKFTDGFDVLNKEGATVVENALVNISFSLPVGLSDAQRTLVRERVVAMINDDTVMDSLIKLGEI